MARARKPDEGASPAHHPTTGRSDGHPRQHPPQRSPTDFVFAGSAAGGRLTIRPCGCCCASLVSDYDVHGFRTTFKSFCLDNLKHVLDEPAVELAHDHAIGGKVAETYRDTSLIGHRRILNERWSSYLRGVAYTGLCEMPALSLVVDNAAVA